MTNSADAAANPVELTKARTEAINLVQWLARVANSYVSDGDPARRTDLEFRAADTTFVTRQFGAGLALEMRLPALQLQFLDHGKPMPHIFDPEERSPAEVEAWILVELLHRGVERDKFSTKLPYTIPGLMTGDAEDHSPRSCRRGLGQLAAWFRQAATIIGAAGRAAGAKQIHVLCLPQTLDLVGTTETGPRVTFGFSPGDARNPEPYFFALADASIQTAQNPRRPLPGGAAALSDGDPSVAARRLLELACR